MNKKNKKALDLKLLKLLDPNILEFFNEEASNIFSSFS
jgi:hypothetical protein